MSCLLSSLADDARVALLRLADQIQRKTSGSDSLATAAPS
jgi:hypothetical protein